MVREKGLKLKITINRSSILDKITTNKNMVL